MHDTNKKYLPDTNGKVALTLQSWGRYETPNLRVDPGLLGAAHSFDHEGTAIKVSLPNASEATDNDRVTLDHWRGKAGDGQLEPMDYLIHSVDVSGSIPGLHTLPSAVLVQPTNLADVIAAGDRIRLERCASTAGQLALKAFDLWIRCIRWKTGLARFGRTATVGPETGWGNRLRDASTGKMVWRSEITFTVPSRRSMSSGDWESVGSALTAGQSPPVFVDLLFDAEMHIEAGDFRRAVIDAAIAAETYIRTVVRSTLPIGFGKAAGRFIDQGNIRQVLHHLFPEALAMRGNAGYKPSSALQKIFDDRNNIMHSGSVHDLNREKCLSYVKEVHKLIADHVR